MRDKRDDHNRRDERCDKHLDRRTNNKIFHGHAPQGGLAKRSPEEGKVPQAGYLSVLKWASEDGHHTISSVVAKLPNFKRICAAVPTKAPNQKEASQND
jgi:hypothetical protein